MKQDRQLLTLTHLSQLLYLFTAFGGFLVPLVIWLVKRDEIRDLDTQAKEILNFQISSFLLTLVCIPLVLFFGLGLIGLLIIPILLVVFPIINAIKASKGEKTHYPLTIPIIS